MSVALPRVAARTLRLALALLALGGGWRLVDPTGPDLHAAPNAAGPTGTVAALPTLTPRPAAMPTACVIELAPATSSPPPPLTPTPTATPLPVVTLPFVAEDWRGGYYRGERQWYGRTWVAVYGQYSLYPAASLTVALAAAPSGSATLTITGLDDEWAAVNPIVVLVNGVVIYDGLSPWPNWDGVGRGEHAAWTPAGWRIPPGLLQAGSNQIVVANRTPSANFGLPPYVLLADATLQAHAP
jgi:hypothetical protein